MSALAAFIVTSVVAAAPCSEGRVDAQGHCCWPGQSWSKSKSSCVGAPKCPSGIRLGATDCMPACEAGRVASTDTFGHCCWPAQAWSNSRNACVGVPQCPSTLAAVGEECTVKCDPGMAASADTLGHCCWPEQAWSASRQVCVGVPKCPMGWKPQRELCIVDVPELPPSPEPPPVPPPVVEAAPFADAGVAAAPLNSPDAGVVLAPQTLPPGPPAAVAAAPGGVTALAPPPTGRVHPPSAAFFVGAGLFLLGWVPAVVLSQVYKSYIPNVSAVAPIPIAGPILVRNTLSDYNLAQGWHYITIGDALLQTAGAVCLVAGAIVWAVGRPATENDNKVVRWWLTPQGAGATVRW
jgi:hypothetical protein